MCKCVALENMVADFLGPNTTGVTCVDMTYTLNRVTTGGKPLSFLPTHHPLSLFLDKEFLAVVGRGPV